MCVYNDKYGYKIHFGSVIAVREFSDGFQKSLGHCSSGENSLSIGRVNKVDFCQLYV